MSAYAFNDWMVRLKDVKCESTLTHRLLEPGVFSSHFQGLRSYV
jgi:hypothetical protein